MVMLAGNYAFLLTMLVESFEEHRRPMIMLIGAGEGVRVPGLRTCSASTSGRRRAG